MGACSSITGGSEPSPAQKGSTWNLGTAQGPFRAWKTPVCGREGSVGGWKPAEKSELEIAAEALSALQSFCEDSLPMRVPNELIAITNAYASSISCYAREVASHRWLFPGAIQTVPTHSPYGDKFLRALYSEPNRVYRVFLRVSVEEPTLSLECSEGPALHIGVFAMCPAWQVFEKNDKRFWAQCEENGRHALLTIDLKTFLASVDTEDEPVTESVGSASSWGNDDKLNASVGVELPVTESVGVDEAETESRGNDDKLNASVGVELPVTESVGVDEAETESGGIGIDDKSSMGVEKPVTESVDVDEAETASRGIDDKLDPSVGVELPGGIGIGEKSSVGVEKQSDASVSVNRLSRTKHFMLQLEILSDLYASSLNISVSPSSDEPTHKTKTFTHKSFSCVRDWHLGFSTSLPNNQVGLGIVSVQKKDHIYIPPFVCGTC